MFFSPFFLEGGILEPVVVQLPRGSIGSPHRLFHITTGDQRGPYQIAIMAVPLPNMTGCATKSHNTENSLFIAASGTIMAYNPWLTTAVFLSFS